MRRSHGCPWDADQKSDEPGGSAPVVGCVDASDENDFIKLEDSSDDSDDDDEEDDKLRVSADIAGTRSPPCMGFPSVKSLWKMPLNKLLFRKAM